MKQPVIVSALWGGNDRAGRYISGGGCCRSTGRLSYVDEVAEAIRAHVATGSLPSADTAPLFRLYAVLALTKGEAVTLEDVHDAWAAWMTGRDPEHASLKPFDELSSDVQDADAPYRDAIHAVARERGLG
jgi:hypothetical protein